MNIGNNNNIYIIKWKKKYTTSLLKQVKVNQKK